MNGRSELYFRVPRFALVASQFSGGQSVLGDGDCTSAIKMAMAITNQKFNGHKRPPSYSSKKTDYAKSSVIGWERLGAKLLLFGQVDVKLIFLAGFNIERQS
jgi:hypothetical protein